MMESPNKRVKTSSPDFNSQNDFIPLGRHDDDVPIATNGDLPKHLSSGGHGRRPYSKYTNQNENDRRMNSNNHDSRQLIDRPRSKHSLPGYEPWILVKTKLRRRFVHNTETKQSFWRIPSDTLPGVLEFERRERDQEEKSKNARWAEEQLTQMRAQSEAVKTNQEAGGQELRRRRRSESLQREDEEALMAELVAQTEHDEEEDVKETFKAIEPLQPQQGSVLYDTDGSYEEVEVTDSEFEDDDDRAKPIPNTDTAPNTIEDPNGDGPVEFGEDDIAYQLAAMGDQYGLDPEEYGEGEEDWQAEAEEMALSEEDAINLFRDLLDDYRVSPFTPWDKLIADETDTSILNDDRYTVLRSMRARKEAWDSWARDKAAEIKRLREVMERKDPKIPYLAFLQDKATPKLYWPEFKRKYKREAEMNERKLSDKDREKLYRDHLTRLKLPESSRKADLQTLLKSIPLKPLNRATSLDSLPQSLLSHLHYISLPPSVRDPMIESFIKRLPQAPEVGDTKTEE